MTSFAVFCRSALVGAVAASALGAWLLATVLGASAALGFGLGGGAGSLALGFHGRHLARRGPSPAGAQRGALLRTGLRAGALVLAHLSPGVSLSWTAAGLFVGPAALLAAHVLGPPEPEPRAP